MKISLTQFFNQVKRLVCLLYFINCSDFRAKEDCIRYRNDSEEIITILLITFYEDSIFWENRVYKNLGIDSTTEYERIVRDDGGHSSYSLEVRSNTASGLSHNQDITFRAKADEEEDFTLILKADGSVEVKKEPTKPKKLPKSGWQIIDDPVEAKKGCIR